MFYEQIMPTREQIYVDLLNRFYSVEGFRHLHAYDYACGEVAYEDIGVTVEIFVEVQPRGWIGRVWDALRNRPAPVECLYVINECAQDLDDAVETLHDLYRAKYMPLWSKRR